MRIEVYEKLQPSADDPDVPAEPKLDQVIADGDMFPGRYLGWSEQFSEISDDWQVEKSRDPRAPLVRSLRLRQRGAPKPSSAAQRLILTGHTYSVLTGMPSLVGGLKRTSAAKAMNCAFNDGNGFSTSAIGYVRPCSSITM